jgi:hypothetical protein
MAIAVRGQMILLAGKFNDTNSNGVNFTFTATTPVVSPQPQN